MKLKSVLFIACFGLMTHAWTSNIHSYPGANSADSKATTNNANSASACMIKIINDLNTPVDIDGTYTDGMGLIPFTMRPYGDVQFIDLYYNWNCHSEMYRIGMDYVNLYHVRSGKTLYTSDYLYANKAAKNK